MAHFAELNENNSVVSVIVVHNNELLVDGIENEEKGIAFCNTIKNSNWVQTSYNANFRKSFAIIGGSYDSVRNEFVYPQPYASWSLDSNNDWQSPTPKPEGNFYWDEESLSWLPFPDAG